MSKSKDLKGKKLMRASDHGKQHQKKKVPTKRELALAFADKHADMPDGAFWALAEQKGLMPEDFVHAKTA